MIKNITVHPMSGDIMFGTTHSFITLNPQTGNVNKYPLPKEVNEQDPIIITTDRGGHIYLSDGGLLLRLSETKKLETIADFSHELWDCGSAEV